MKMTFDAMNPSFAPCAAPQRGVSSQPHRGFTLLELMIVVVVIGILAALAYPSYTEYVARGHRTQVKAQLSAAQQWMERRYSERYFYGDAAASTTNSAFANQPFAASPPSAEGAARYALGVVVTAGGQGYTITAVRAGTMSTDACGDPTVTNTGVKGLAEDSRGDRFASDAAAIEACWR